MWTKQSKMAALEEAFIRAASLFKILELNAHQKRAIQAIVVDKKDVFVNLPTGFGKSLIYQALPFVFDHVNKSAGHIVVVVSPLVSLMDDQVKILTDLGLSAISISSQEELDVTKIEKGEYSIVFGSPEAWLMNDRWRRMLDNHVYSNKLCAVAIDEAHVLRQWGISQDSKKAAFRECYAHLHELRSLAPKARMIALTATATKLTKDTILNVLLMENPYEIKESPNKSNVTYSVEYMPKDSDHELYFGWLVDELIKTQSLCERTIIYCQTIKQCGIIYATIKGMLGNHMYRYVIDANDSKYVLVEMLHSCTPAANKQQILHSFQTEHGKIRVLIATIAFGMGVDCKGVHRIVHYGPSKNVEAYVQETGRAGRDGRQSHAYILYHGILLNHVEGDIKSVLKTDGCRRKALFQHFETVLEQFHKPHLCCDNCASTCKCGESDCNQHAAFPKSEDLQAVFHSSREREVTAEKKKAVEVNLIKYHKLLVMKLFNTAANGNVKTLTNLQFMVGFSEHQISQVLKNLERIFTFSDILNVVEIWDRRHAEKILSVIADVFKDIENAVHVNTGSLHTEEGDDQYDFDDEFMDEWNKLLQDDELFDMIIENMSLSKLQSSLIEEEINASSDMLEDGVPRAVLDTIESMNMDG